MLPNFLIIGASKAGTTSLKQYLREHPDIFLAPGREPQFFTQEFNWHRGIDWYEGLFSDAGDERAVGEKSTTYTRYPHSLDVPKRIAAHLPDVKLLYMVREPIERIRSAYAYAVATGREHDPIDVALAEKPVYTDPSRYSMQIEQYLEVFPRERLLVLTAEDLREEREGTLRRVYEFLDVDSEWRPATLDWEFNRTAAKRRDRSLLRLAKRLPLYDWAKSRAPAPMKRLKRRLATTPYDADRAVISDGMRARLVDDLRADIARLRDHLGADFHCWGLA